MSHTTGIPPQTFDDRPVKRTRTRYYAHRVHESLTSRISKMFCSIFLFLLLIVGVLVFVLWLSLRPHRPRFHMENFSVPGISNAGSFQDTAISFEITVRNPNQNIGIFYDAMQGSVYYGEQLLASTNLLYPFYQKPKNTTWLQGDLNSVALPAEGGAWRAIQSDRSSGTVYFRVGLRATIRFKVTTWDSKHHRMHVSCSVAVGPNGVILDSSKDKRCTVYF